MESSPQTVKLATIRGENLTQQQLSTARISCKVKMYLKSVNRKRENKNADISRIGPLKRHWMRGIKKILTKKTESI